jgi:hypothetical protein
MENIWCRYQKKEDRNEGGVFVNESGKKVNEREKRIE